jgi:hypothetical protein
MAFGGSQSGFGRAAGGFVKAKKKPVQIVGEMEAAFRARKEASKAQFKDGSSTDYYLVIVFQNSAQVDEVEDFFGIPRKSRFIDGIEMMRVCGVEIETKTGNQIKPKVDQKLAALTENGNGEGDGGQ